MRFMGGLRRYTPVTFWTMTAATFAISGIFPFSGFFSKDEILYRSWASQYGSWGFWAVGVFAASLTAFYMFRLWFLTFFGDYRGQPVPEHHVEPAGREHHEESRHIHESPKVMLIPLVLLALLSLGGGWVGWPQVLGGGNHFEHFLAPVFEEHVATAGEAAAAAPAEGQAPSEIALSVAATGSALFGIAVAWFLYYKRRDLPARLRDRFHGVYTTLENKYYVDEIYSWMFVRPVVEGSRNILWRAIDAGVIDGTVNESAEAAREVSNGLRRMQSGNLRSYAGWVALGGAAVVAYMVWLGVR
jgi:NADH-quinone oxidoreductase subunit L